MPAKRPNGARNETVRCEKCGEDYAVTYKRCPFCEDDEPTLIFRRPKIQEPEEELPPRRRRPEPEEDEDYAPVHPVRPVQRETEDDDDEYEELFRRRAPKAEPEAPRSVRRAPAREEPREVPPPRRRAPRDEEDDDYEEPRRRSRRYEDDEDEYEEPKRRRRRDDDYDDYDEDDDDYEPRGRRDDGGRRLVTNARGGGYRHRGPSPMQVIGAVLSIALIVAAVWIVATIVKTFIGKSPADPGVADPTPSISASVPPSASPSQEPGDIVIPSDDPSSQPPVVGDNTDTTPPPVQTTIPDGQTATGFDLGKTEFTLSEQYPTYTFKVKFSPDGSTGSITWHSSKPNIVTVDQNGTVTAVAQGVATITATMAGGYSKQCMVRSTFGGTPGALPSTAPSTAPSAAPSAPPSTAPSTSPSTGGKLSLNVGLGLDGKTYDFSLKAGETWSLKVKNAAGAVSWSVKDSSIATVDANGKVAGVSKGMTTVTASVDGQTLECIVRVS